jgi:hypothetical protein
MTKRAAAMRWAVAAVAVAAAGCGNGGGGAPIDARVGPDGPVIDAAAGIDCRREFCDLPGLCCVDQIQPPRPEFFCIGEGGEEGCQGARFFCDGPEDCGEEEVCCTSVGDRDDVACVPEDSCDGFVVCHIQDHCPAGTACYDTTLRVIRVCQ